jgi:hypothetical protein
MVFPYFQIKLDKFKLPATRVARQSIRIGARTMLLQRRLVRQLRAAAMEKGIKGDRGKLL